MADSTDALSSGDSVQSKLKKDLKDWRQLVLTLHSVLVWDKDYYPMAMSAIVSIVFLLIWFLETSVLTTLSAIGIVATIVDYGLPLVVNNFFNPLKWFVSRSDERKDNLFVFRNDSNESKFDHICEELSENWITIVGSYRDWQRLKASNPKVYYSVLLSSLLVLSWIANIVHNLLLTYLFVLFVVLFPGLKNRGIIDKYVTLLMSYVSKVKRN